MAILLFGTTILWFMPSFLGADTTVEGAIWSAIQLPVLASVFVLLVPSLGRGLDRRLAGQP